jgi:hypothetical protein
MLNPVSGQISHSLCISGKLFLLKWVGEAPLSNGPAGSPGPHYDYFLSAMSRGTGKLVLTGLLATLGGRLPLWSHRPGTVGNAEARQLWSR